jgi:hypothetical protein
MHSEREKGQAAEIGPSLSTRDTFRTVEDLALPRPHTKPVNETVSNPPVHSGIFGTDITIYMPVCYLVKVDTGTVTPLPLGLFTSEAVAFRTTVKKAMERITFHPQWFADMSGIVLTEEEKARKDPEFIEALLMKYFLAAKNRGETLKIEPGKRLYFNFNVDSFDYRFPGESFSWPIFVSRVKDFQPSIEPASLANPRNKVDSFTFKLHQMVRRACPNYVLFASKTASAAIISSGQGQSDRALADPYWWRGLKLYQWSIYARDDAKQMLASELTVSEEEALFNLIRCGVQHGIIDRERVVETLYPAGLQPDDEVRDAHGRISYCDQYQSYSLSELLLIRAYTKSRSDRSVTEFVAYVNDNFLEDASPLRTTVIGFLVVGAVQSKGYHLGLFPYDAVNESIDTLEDRILL